MAAANTFKNFKEILTNLLNSDNNIRSSAELHYLEVPETDKVYHLLEVLGDNSSTEEAELAAVLLRKLISNSYNEVFSKLSPEVHEQIKTRLLHQLASNMNQSLKRKLCEVVSELARNCIGNIF
ncbi:importin-5 [Trichonephila clavata]|uniref:Importin-5 n=1 Tax=Trichonephila clavata TaxID=2740835 RepID=A0A8X6LLE6_TRICU|nr:importin-5 [Trichonephila clavata]